MAEKKADVEPLMIGRVRYLIDQLKGVVPQLEELADISDATRNQIQKQVADYALSIRMAKLKPEELEAFFKKPYDLSPMPGRRDSWYLRIPRFVDIQFGWLDHQTESFNTFIVSRYMDWLGELPEKIKQELGFKPPPDLKLDGEILSGSPRAMEEAWRKYRPYLKDRDEKRIIINKRRSFELLTSLIKDHILPFTPKPVDPSDLVDRYYDPAFKLRPYQKEAWDIFMRYSNIGVFFPASTGKTIVGLYLMTHLKPPHLVAVPTILLKEQWEERIKAHTDLKPDEYTVCTYYTAVKKHGEKEWTSLIIDECLAGTTLVTTEDGGIKELREVKDRDRVLGGLASNKFSRKSNDLYHIRTSFSDMIATGTHPHIVVRKRRDRHNNQWFRTAEKDITTVQSRELKIGDCLMVPKKLPHIARRSWTPEQLRLVALIACDGHIERNRNVVKIAVRKKGEKEWIRKSFIEGVRAFGINDHIGEFFNNRGDFIIECCSPELARTLSKTFEVPRGRKSNLINISNEIFYSPIESIKSFIETCFSCEGWLCKERSGSKRIYFSSTSKSFILKLQLLLKKLGIHSGVTIHIRRREKHAPLYQLYVGNFDFNKAMEVFSFPRLSLNSTERNIGRNMNDEFGLFRLARVLKTEKLDDEMEVYDFTSNGTNTFLANGMLTHNCHHMPANQFSKLSFIKRRYTLGLSATPQREDKREELIFALTGRPVGLGWEHFKQLGIIKSPVCRVWIVKNFAAKLARLKALIDPEVKTLVFCDSIEIGKTISKRFDIPHVYGQTKGRLDLIEKSPVAVVSRVGDEGISLPTVGKVIEVSWLYGSRRQELQRFTRLLHGFEITGEGEHHILMTLDEYLHDRKRLFSVMDKGFKVEIHREGISERAVEKRLTETWRPRRVARPRKEEPALPAEPVPQGPVAEVLNLPGVQRIMQTLSKSEQRFWKLLLQNDGSWFRRDKLPLLLGYTSEDSMGHLIRFGKLVERGYIEQSKIDGKFAYRTNMRAKVG